MILHGDCLLELANLPNEHVQTCVTSPPYWGLRDYGVDGQLGLEKTPDEYVANLVRVFREVRRVLKDDGTLWLNLGDSYCGGGNNRGNGSPISGKQSSNAGATGQVASFGVHKFHSDVIKPKDLVGIPWRVAFALQADGWYLRQDIIWHKPNPMPESVRDRCTKAHEYIFLLSKQPKYYFDVDAIKEPAVSIKGAGNKSRTFDHTPKPGVGAGIPWQPTVFRAREKKNGENAVDTKLRGHGSHCGTTALRHKRSVWSVTTKSFKGAHFATFPPDLIEPCILAGSACGDYVLDPFAGSGTTGMVAGRRGRKFIGIELNSEYVQLAEKRIGGCK